MDQTAASKQSTDDHLYRIDMERVHLVSNIRVRTAFVVNQVEVFEVSIYVPSDYFGLATCLKA